MGGPEELPRRPWWQVIGVLDHEGEGREFAYTVGLAERGLPELHVASRPSLGEDPGADWHFSISDLGGILNHVAWRLADGRLRTGDTWEDELDAGLVTVRFRLDPPQDGASLEAFQAGDAPVHPVRWSLHRPPEGAPTPMEPDALAQAAQELSGVLPVLTQEPAPPPGWELADPVSWGPEQRWGPRTPLVQARAQQLRAIAPADLIGVLNLAMVLGYRTTPSYAVVVALSAARPVGRARALEQLLEDTTALVGELGVSWGVRAWRAANDWINDDDPDPFPEERVREVLAEVIRPYLVCVAAQDLLTPDLVVLGTGPVLCPTTPDGRPPSPAWHASEHVVAAVRRVVMRAGAARVAEAAAAWREADSEEATQARGDVVVHAATTAAMFPYWRRALPRGLVAALTTQQRSWDLTDQDVQDWLTALSTTLSHRTQLEPATIAVVLECGAPLPGLRTLVNEPLTALDGGA
jgi:hypothetical protein